MEYPPKLRPKKGWLHQTEEAPLPIPIQSLTDKPASNSRWFYYTAKLIDGTVLVHKEGDQHCLYRMGFFGKGNLSRGKPEHTHFVSSYQGHQRRSLPATERRFQQTRFQKVRQHRYERHLSWSKLNLLKKKEKAHTESEQPRHVPFEGTPSSSKDHPYQLIEQESSDELVGIGSNVTDSLSQEELAGTMGSSEDEETKDSEENHSFDIEQTEKKGEDSGKDYKVDVGEWTLSPEESQTAHIRVHEVPGSSEHPPPIKERTSQFSFSMDGCRTSGSDHRKAVQRHHSDGVDSSQPFATVCADDLALKRTFTDRDLRDDEIKKKLRKEMRVAEMRCSSDHDCGMDEEKRSAQDRCEVSKSDTELSRLNLSAESSGDIKETEKRNQEAGRDTKEKRQKISSKKANVTRKPDPYPIRELLQLSYEETFFLSYGLGCLSLLNPSRSSAQEVPMNLTDIWTEFLILKPRFVATYACYHYYRSKGWVPRCGSKYGCDFVIYKKGPSFNHSSFAVLAHLTAEGSEMTSALTSWYNFTGFSRIIENAAKDVILCYVTYPDHFTERQLKSPACIPYLKVHEICIKRWRPTRERESKDYPAMIS